jgi:hypothetical protein
MAKSVGPIDWLRKLRATNKASKIAKTVAPELKAVSKARSAKRAQAAAKADAARKASATTSSGTKELKEIKVTAAKPSKSAFKKIKSNRADIAKERQEKKKQMKFLFGVNLPISTLAAAAVTEGVTRARGEKSTKPKTIKTSNKLKKVKIKNK